VKLSKVFVANVCVGRYGIGLVGELLWFVFEGYAVEEGVELGGVAVLEAFVPVSLKERVLC
jgi:hypothetical protein